MITENLGFFVVSDSVLFGNQQGSLAVGGGGVQLNAIDNIRHLQGIIALDTVNFSTTGGIQIGVFPGVTFQALMTADFLNAFNNHTHNGVTPGSGRSGTPTLNLPHGAPLETVALLAN